MPYYLFKIETRDKIGLVKNLELLEVFEDYREARTSARQRREAQSDTGDYKLMFADNQLSAETQLMEKRERPVLMEHER